MNIPRRVKYKDLNNNFILKMNNEEEIIDMTPNILVIGPGGNKGFLYLGSLLYLEEYEYLDLIDTYVGCSVGSIISLLLVIGLKIDDIVKISSNIDLVKNINLFGITNSYGISNTKHIITKLKEVILQKYEYIPSMLELYNLTNLNLTIVSHNLSKHETEYFDHIKTPNMKCIDCVKLSINIPIIYEKISYNNNIYIDGAMGNPYPINIYDDGLNNIIGLYIDSNNTNNDKYNNFLSYIYNVISTPMKTMRNMIIKNSSQKCINIPLLFDINSTGFDLSYQEEERKSMMDTGYNTTKHILENIFIE